MKPLMRSLPLLMLSLLLGMKASAANPILVGQVFLIGDQDEELRPAANVTVRLKGRGDPAITLSQGEFELLLPTITRKGKETPLYGPGETIRLMVEKPDWVIHSPVDGETRHPDDLLKEVVEIRLLPKGSHKLWSHERFRREIQVLKDKTKEQVQPQVEIPQEISFDQHITHIANKLGFDEEEVKSRLDQWATEAEKAEDPYDKALAEYYNKNFSQAKKLFQQSATLKLQELADILQREEDLQKKKLKVIEEAVMRFRGMGDAAYSAYDFPEALSAYEHALEVLPGDQLEGLRAQVQMDIAGANWAIGIRTEGPAVQKHLNRAKQAYVEAAKGYKELGDPVGSASAQVGLGNTLQNQGIRTGGEEGRQLLAEAVAAYRAALEVRTREQLPQQWATTQNNLGTALGDQGIRTGGEEGRQLLAEAVAAYRAALEVRTREQLPQQWATTQNNLGTALGDQGIRTGGEEGRQLLAEAVAAYRAALEVRTREQLPQQWAMTQNNLGATLRDQGIRTGGEEGRQLLAEAVAAYRAALVVRTKESLAPQWTQTHNNLAEAALAVEDWEQVVVSYTNVLELYPDYQDAYLNTNSVLHERLFRFSDSFALNRDWLATHQDDESARMNFAESHLTTGRLAEAGQQFSSFLAQPDLDVQYMIPLRLLNLVSLVGQNQMDSVSGQLNEIGASLATQPEDFTLGWSCEGTKHFIGQHEAFATSRDWLLALLEAFSGTTHDAMLAAVETAQTHLALANSAAGGA